MSDDDVLRRDLLSRIDTRQTAVNQFLRTNRPGIRRRANLTIMLSSLAAVFTAGPALGGENFSGGIQKIFGLSSDSYVWRTLCLLALLVSVGAAVMTNLAKSHEATLNRLTTAEAAKAELEGLATLVQFGHLSVEEAAKLFHHYSTKIPFVDDAPALAGGPRAS
jgi:MFS family permease